MGQIHSGPMTGRTVLVTGGSDGIGRATALGLAAMGAHLAITGRDRGRTEDAAREIRAAGSGQVDTFVADLSSQPHFVLQRDPHRALLQVSPATGLSHVIPENLAKSVSVETRIRPCSRARAAR